MSAVEAKAAIKMDANRFKTEGKNVEQSFDQIKNKGQQAMNGVKGSTAGASAEMQKFIAQQNQAKASTIATAASIGGLSASFVGLYTSVSNLNKGLINIQRAEVAVARAHDLIDSKTVSLNRLEQQKQKIQESGIATAEQTALIDQKIALTRQQLSTATQNLSVYTEDLKQKQDDYNDTVTLFATSIATTALTATSSIILMLSQLATTQGVTIGTFVGQKLAAIGAAFGMNTAAAATGKLTIAQGILNLTMGKWLLIATAVVLAYEGITQAIKYFNKDMDFTIEKMTGDLMGRAFPGVIAQTTEVSNKMNTAGSDISDTGDTVDELTGSTDELSSSLLDVKSSTDSAAASLAAMGSTIKDQVQDPLNEFAASLQKWKDGEENLIPILATSQGTLIASRGAMLGYLESIDETSKGQEKLAKTASQAAEAIEDLKKNYKKIISEANAQQNISGYGLNDSQLAFFASISNQVNMVIDAFRPYGDRFDNQMAKALGNIRGIPQSVGNGLINGGGVNNSVPGTAASRGHGAPASAHWRYMHDLEVASQTQARSARQTDLENLYSLAAMVGVNIGNISNPSYNVPLFTNAYGQVRVGNTWQSAQSQSQFDAEMAAYYASYNAALATVNSAIASKSSFIGVSPSAFKSMLGTEQGRLDIAGRTLFEQRSQKEIMMATVV